MTVSELFARHDKEQHDTHHVHHHHPPEGCRIADVLRDKASEKDTYALPQVPARQDGRVRRTPFVVARYAYHHVLERRPHMSVAQSDEQCRPVVARQHQSHHVLRGPERLRQLQRQQRCQQIEGKEQREVRRHHPPVVGIPESFRILSHLSSV